MENWWYVNINLTITLTQGFKKNHVKFFVLFIVWNFLFLFLSYYFFFLQQLHFGLIESSNSK